MKTTGFRGAISAAPLWKKISIVVACIGVLLFWLNHRATADITAVAFLPLIQTPDRTTANAINVGFAAYASRLFTEAVDLEVVPAVKVVASLKQSGQSSTQLAADPAALQALQESWPASHVVIAELRGSAPDYQLQTTVYGERSQTALLGVSTLAEAAAEAVKVTLSELPGWRTSRPFRTVSNDSEVTRQYIQARGRQLNGDIAGARESYQWVTDREPSLFWPRYELALVNRQSNDLVLAEQQLQELLPLAEEEPDKLARIATLNALAQVLWQTGRLEQASNRYQDALALSQRIGDARSTGTILINLGILARSSNDYSGARRYFLAASEAQRKAGQQPDGFLDNALGLLALAEGEFDTAKRYLETAAQRFSEAGRQREAANSFNALAGLLRRDGDWPEAERRYQASAAISREHGDAVGEAGAQLALGELAKEQFQFHSAAELGRSVLSLAEQSGDRRLQLNALLLTIESGLQVDDLKVMESGYPALLSMAQEASSTEQLAIQLLSARVALMQDDLPQALMLAQQVSNRYQQLGFQRNLMVSRSLLSEIHAASGDWSSAITQLDMAIASSRENGELALLAGLLIRHADLQLSAGQPELAARSLQELKQLQPDWLMTHALSAYLQFEQGDQEQAKAAFRQVEQSWQGELNRLLRSWKRILFS